MTSIPGIPTRPYSGASSAARRLASISSWSVTASASRPTPLACSKRSSTGSRASYESDECACNSTDTQAEVTPRLEKPRGPPHATEQPTDRVHHRIAGEGTPIFSEGGETGIEVRGDVGVIVEPPEEAVPLSLAGIKMGWDLAAQSAEIQLAGEFSPVSTAPALVSPRRAGNTAGPGQTGRLRR